MFKQNISFDVWGGKNGKYRLKDQSGKDLESTPEETCHRVCKSLSDIEADDKKDFWYAKFSSIMGTKFAGGGRIMANVGAMGYKKETSPINCTVMRQIPDSILGIMQVATEAALTLKAGCGVGYDFSTIRPKGANVFGAGAETSGIISFMKIFDAVCSTIMSGGSRRGAQMGCLDIQSPEIEEFITAKRQDGVLRFFNCSVLITDSFMKAVENDKSWDLWFWEKDRERKISDVDSDKVKLIKKNDIPYNHFSFDMFRFAEDHCEVESGNTAVDSLFLKKVYKTVRAKDIFDLVMRSTFEFSEPGFLMIDRANIENNLYFCETMRCTNPCVTGDTRIATQHGYMTVKDLYDSQARLNVTVDNRVFDKGQGVSIRSAVPIFMTAEKAKVFKVKTKHGYEIKATEWHEFYTQRGKIKLKDMSVGDTLYLQSGKGQFGNKGSEELGEIIGLITGDGHFSKRGNGTYATLGFWGDDIDLADKYLLNINKIISNVISNNHKKPGVSIIKIPSRNNVIITSRLLARYLDELNFNAKTKLRVPEVIWSGTEKCIKGYLSALFQADGTVNINGSYGRIALNSSSPDLLKDVQKLLINFGIVSSIHLRKKACWRMMPNGKGGEKKYYCKDNYELFISRESILLFQKYIGFMHKIKNDKINNWIKNHSFYADNYQTKISSIEFYGEESVFDTTQKDHNAVIFNGLSTGQCGEQYLSPQAACLLGSMILPEYVNNAFEKDASFNFDSFYKDICVANRALDNVVELNNLPLQEMREQILQKRRHGLGVTGLGSALNMLGIKYGSKESIELAEKIAFINAEASLRTNIELAKEKGCAPIFKSLESKEAVLKSKYLSRLINALEDKEQVISDILKYGLRYSHATSYAPTGTMSLTWGNNCSNGIEPVFADWYYRNIRKPGKKTKTQEEVFDYAFFLWKQKFGDAKLPEYWTTAKSLGVSDHIVIQSVMQKWCDSSISKTINIPSDYPFEEFKKVYMDGWKAGLKGVTTFKFNPDMFSGVLVQQSDLENTNYTFTDDSGKEYSLKGSDQVEYDGDIHNVANLFDALKEGMYGNM